MEKIEIHEGEKGLSFFSIHESGGAEVGRMTVSVKGSKLEAGYTSVAFAQRKNGYGKKLIDAVVDYAKENNLKVVAKCGFVAMIFNKYPEAYKDIRAEP